MDAARCETGLRQPSGIPRLLCGLNFGRKQWRDHSGNYLQALLVQDQEPLSAENLSESVGISARANQRFLTEARWSDETVIGRLQEYLAPRLDTRRRCGCSMAGTSPSRAGNRREWPGSTAAGWARCQLPGWDVPGLRSAAGPGVGGQAGCILTKSWTSDQDRYRCGGCAGGPAGTTGQRRSWPWTCWSGSWSWATSGRSELPETTPSGCRRPSGREWRPWDSATCWTFWAALRSGPWTRLGPVRNIRGSAAPQTQAAAWA